MSDCPFCGEEMDKDCSNCGQTHEELIRQKLEEATEMLYEISKSIDNLVEALYRVNNIQ